MSNGERRGEKIMRALKTKGRQTERPKIIQKCYIQSKSH